MSQRLSSLLFICSILIASSALADIPLPDLVQINDINNAPNLHMGDKYGYGRVEHPYRIAKDEVTNAQYAALLNSVAAQDIHELYSEKMASESHGGIDRKGDSGHYTYHVKPGMENEPVVYVDYLDAVRYCNWLSCGKTETGVYSITTIKRYDDTSIEAAMRDLNTLDQPSLYYLPDRHEWYKAGYYNAPTQSYRSITDANSTEPSAYGTLHQTDQAREWLETSTRQYRRAIGGSWLRTSDKDRNALDWQPTSANQKTSDLGFRIAATPRVQLVGQLNDQHNYFLDGHNTATVQIRYDGQPVQAQIQITLSDYLGKTLQNKAQTLALQSGKQIAATFTAPPTDGYYELTVTVDINGEQHVFNPLPLVVADKPINRPTDLKTLSFGVTGHLGKFAYDYTTFSDPAATLNLYRYAGITLNRMDGPWELVIDQAHRSGLLNLIVLPPVGWNYDSWKTPENKAIIDKWAGYGVSPEFAGYAEFVLQKVSQYKDKVDAWELTNEPWGKIITPEDYAQSAKVAAKAVRMADPHATVLLGDTTFRGELILPTGAGQLCDVASFHVYSFFREYFWGIPTRLRNIRKLMDQYGMAGKPIWLTETSGCGYGMHIYPGKNRREVRHYQAFDLPKKMLGSLAVGADKTFFYNFRDTPAHGVENEFGMVHTDLTPKPAFAAYRTAAKYFTGAQYVGTIDLPREFTGYVFNKDGQQQAILWRRDTQSQELGTNPPSLPTMHAPQKFSFSATGDVTMVSLMGETQSLQSSKGNVDFAVNEYPIYIMGNVTFPMQQTDNATQTTLPLPIAKANVRIMPQMPVTRRMRDLEKPSIISATWGQKNTITLRLFNQSDQPIDGVLSLQTPQSWLPDAWQVLSEPQAVRIAAHGSLTQTLSFQPPQKDPVNQKQFLITATLTLADGQTFADRAIVTMQKDNPYLSWKLAGGEQGKNITFENKLEDIDARLRWKEEHHKWTELYTAPSPVLAKDSLDELKVYSLKIRTNTPEQLTHINLRLRDSSGEVFQYRLTPKLDTGEWFKLEYDLPNAKPQGHWSGNNDGKLDLPVVLQGLSVEFNMKNLAEGSLEMMAE
jgi:hypothetical protein